MAISTTMLLNDFNFMRTDLPQIVTIGGVAVTAVVEDLQKTGEELLDAGINSAFSLVAHVLKSEFSTQPDAASKVTYSGAQYRVIHWQDSSDGLVRTLYLEEEGA